MNPLLDGIENNDKKIIKWQLKNQKVSISGIIEKCKWNFPYIVLLNPVRDPDIAGSRKKIVDYMAMSTLIWLTCPYLNEKIHDLESEGYIKKISEFINSDRGFVEKMQFAHAHYFFLRKKIYRYYLGEVSSLDENNKLFNSGIGGITDTFNLKCLHIHYAHSRICMENVSGKAVSRLLDENIYCSEGICSNAG